MKKYPKQKYPNDSETDGLLVDGRLFIQEKLDGMNMGFMLERNLDTEYHTQNRDLVFRSRNIVFKNPRDENKQFAEYMDHVRSSTDIGVLREYEDEYGQLVVFGEAMETHTIQGYDWETIPPFIGFDVWMADVGTFMEPPDAATLIENIGLEYAPFFAKTTAEEWLNNETPLHDEDGSVEVPQSHYGDVQAEGFMFKNPDTNTYAKLVREDFKEKNKKVFEQTPDEPSGAIKCSREYITNARIRKNAHKLVNEGPWDSLKVAMMEDLPEAVIRDMADEEAGDIIMGENYELDLHEFRSDVSSRCATILRKMINEQVMHGDE